MSTKPAEANPYADFIDEKEELDPTKLASISKLAAQIQDEEAGIERLEKELTEAKQRHKKLTEVDMPDLMDEIGVEEFTTAEGLGVKVEKKTRTSLPAARMEEGCDWLEEHGHAAIIKRMVSVAFNKDDEEKAKLMAEVLGNTFEQTEQKRTVHPSTLNAHIRQLIDEGADVDLDLFGVFEQRKAKIKQKKRK